MTTRSVPLAGVDWTAVLVTGIPATIGAIFAGVAMVIAALNRGNLHTGNGESIGHLVQQTRERTEDLKTPSGQPVGKLTEEAWELAQTHTEHLQALDRKVNGG